ncbi:MAG TPA: GT4 family glycosyltransferase PelF [Acidimicrobiales bacterium]|nr:GT4 family glycosyltransferase PelF [Acidimicrobiales bacterium]
MRVYLSTEGTYPFVLGGVSTWVDMLVNGLPDHHFDIGAVVDNPNYAMAYNPPANVTIQPLPLWGLELAEEYLPHPDAWRRSWRTSPAVVRHRFLPPWERLVNCLAAPEADTLTLGDALSGVAHFAESHDLRRALGDAGTWAVLLDRLMTNPIHARCGLAPAMAFARTLYRYLLPLTVPIPVSDLSHSSAAALCALPAIVAKYRYGTPLVLTEHGIYLRERLLALSGEPFGTKLLFSNFYRAVCELAYRESDVLIPVCAYNGAWEEALGVERARIRVIHNGVDPARIAVRPEPAGPPTVGFVGRIDPLKDVLTLIRAFARVHGVLPDATLRLWGPSTSAHYMDQCQAAVTELGLSAVVTFEGPTDDPAAAYAACHVVALSSISEAFPYTVVEAMLARRPVVATAVGGVTEALGGARCREVPIVVEPGDPGAMAGALVAVLGASPDERHRLGSDLRERALTYFTARRLLDGYDAIYHELARPAPAPAPAPPPDPDSWPEVDPAVVVAVSEAV